MTTCTVCSRSDRPTVDTPIGPVCERCNVPVVMGPLLAKAGVAAPTPSPVRPADPTSVAVADISAELGTLGTPLLVVGVSQIVFGGLYVVVSGFAMIQSGPMGMVGVAAGMVALWMGVILYQAGSSAGRAPTEPSAILDSIESLGTYFRAIMVLTILSWVVGGIALLAMVSML